MVRETLFHTRWDGDDQMHLERRAVWMDRQRGVKTYGYQTGLDLIADKIWISRFYH